MAGTLAGAESLGTLVVYLAANATQFERQMKTVSGSFENQMEQMLTNAKYMAVGVVGVLATIGTAGVAAFSKFESSFAGVRKTVDATEQEFQKFSDTFRQMAMEIPINVNEINSIAEAAGQLGIENKNIVGFTRTMADLGVATDLASTQAASSLAQFANITQMSQEDFDRLGSTIVGLGNNMATTESQIVEMGMRLAGAAKGIGMMPAEIMGMSAALSSLGIKAEAGGTAMSQVMIAMSKAVAMGGEQLELFAAASGKTVKQMKDDFGKDAAGAVFAFTEGLGKLQKQGTNINVVLDQMGLDAARMTDVLSRLSGSEGQLRNAMALANKEWEKNTALADEAEKRYATFASQMTILQNIFNDALITIGQELVPILKVLIGFIKDGSKETQVWKDDIQLLADIIKTGLVVALDIVGGIIIGWKVILKGAELWYAGVFKTIIDLAMTTSYAVIGGINKAIDIINTLKQMSNEKFGTKFEMFKQLDDSGPRMKILKEYAYGAEKAVADLTAELDKLTKQELPSTLIEKELQRQREAAERATAAEIERQKALYNSFNLDSIDRKSGALGESPIKVKTIEYLEFIKMTEGPLAQSFATLDKFRKLLETNQITGTQYAQAMRDLLSQANEFIAPVGGLQEMTGNQSTDQIIGLQNEEKLLTDSYERRLATEKAYYESKGVLSEQMEEERIAVMSEMESRYNARMKAFGEQRNQMMIGNLGDMANQLMGIAEGFGNEQSGFYKTAFAISKAFAISQAIMNAELASTNALAMYPPPGNVAMAAIAKGLGYASAGVILGQTLASFEGGGMTPSGPRIGGLDGRGGKLAVLHPDEKIKDMKRDYGDENQMSGIQINIPQNFQPGVSHVELAASAAKTKQAAMEGVIEAISRGGSYRRAINRGN